MPYICTNKFDTREYKIKVVSRKLTRLAQSTAKTKQGIISAEKQALLRHKCFERVIPLGLLYQAKAANAGHENCD